MVLEERPLPGAAALLGAGRPPSPPAGEDGPAEGSSSPAAGPERLRPAAEAGGDSGSADGDGVASSSSGSGHRRSGTPPTAGGGDGGGRPPPPPKPQRRKPSGLAIAGGGSPAGSASSSRSTTPTAATTATASPAIDVGPLPAPASSVPAASTSSSSVPSPGRRRLPPPLLHQQLLEEAEQHGLLSPFTSVMEGALLVLPTVAAASATTSGSGGSSASSSCGGDEEEEADDAWAADKLSFLNFTTRAPSSEAGGSTAQESGLLDGVSMVTAEGGASPEPTQEQDQQEQEQSLPPALPPPSVRTPRLSLGDDGFLTSPAQAYGETAATASATAATDDGSGTSPESSSSSPSTASSASSSSPAQQPPPPPRPPKRGHARRISLPGGLGMGLGSSNTGATPRTGTGTGTGRRLITPRSGLGGSGSGGSGPVLSLEALRAKLSGGRALPPTPLSKGDVLDASGGGATSSASHSALVQSARRLGLDISGLRKALLVRVLGVEPLANGNGNGQQQQQQPPQPGKAKRSRSASMGVMPVAWLKRGATNGLAAGAAAPNGTAASARAGETYTIVIWVLDVESGQEWRVRKGPGDLLALHEVVSVLRPGVWKEDFPIRRGKDEVNPLSLDRQGKVERYLRALAAVSADASPSASAYEAAKTLQDFVGATERVDVLVDAQHREEGRHLGQLVQLHCVGILRQDPAHERRIAAFLAEARGCDVQRTELLKVYGSFLGRFARDLMDAHGPKLLAALADEARGSGLGLGPGGLGGGAVVPEGEAEQFCLSALRRLLEAETFLPLRLRLYERVMLETDLAQEQALAARCALFKSRPQSFFGIPVAHISVSSWETAVTHLRRLSGDVTTLPSDKLDVLVAAVREVHALFRREHPEAEGPLGADEFLPVFIYVVSQCGISRLLSLKNMLAALADPAQLLSEAGYCLATLEAAIDYVLRMDEEAGEI